jgi:hypothetical protein
MEGDFFPVRRDQLLSDLLAGKADIAGGGLTITKGTTGDCRFCIARASGVLKAPVTTLTQER